MRLYFKLIYPLNTLFFVYAIKLVSYSGKKCQALDAFVESNFLSTGNSFSELFGILDQQLTEILFKLKNKFHKSEN